MSSSAPGPGSVLLLATGPTAPGALSTGTPPWRVPTAIWLNSTRAVGSLHDWATTLRRIRFDSGASDAHVVRGVPGGNGCRAFGRHVLADGDDARDRERPYRPKGPRLPRRASRYSRTALGSRMAVAHSVNSPVNSAALSDMPPPWSAATGETGMSWKRQSDLSS